MLGDCKSWELADDCQAQRFAFCQIVHLHKVRLLYHMTYAADSLNSFPIPVIAPEIQKDGTKSVFTMGTSALPLNPG